MASFLSICAITAPAALRCATRDGRPLASPFRDSSKSTGSRSGISFHARIAPSIRVWLKHGATYVPLPDDEDVLAVGLNRAGALVDARIG